MVLGKEQKYEGRLWAVDLVVIRVVGEGVIWSVGFGMVGFDWLGEMGEDLKFLVGSRHMGFWRNLKVNANLLRR